MIQVEHAMMMRAAEIGTHIELIATNPGTLESSKRLLSACADRVGKKIAVQALIVEHAFSSILGGDGSTHDRLAKKCILDTAPHADFIVLAQASMERVLKTFSKDECPVPILSSPHMALEQVRYVL